MGKCEVEKLRSFFYQKYIDANLYVVAGVDNVIENPPTTGRADLLEEFLNFQSLSR